MDFIKSNYVLSAIYTLAYILLLSIMSKWLYSLNYMILEDKSFKESREDSKKLIKGSRLIDILKILFVYLLFVEHLILSNQLQVSLLQQKQP